MKTIYSVYSAYTGDDLALKENEISVAQADYKAKNDRYMASVALGSGHARWARSNLLPAVNVAKAYLDGLNKDHEQMLKDVSQQQGVDLTALGTRQVSDAAAAEPAPIPYTTIALAVGALVVIVLIFKML